MSRKKDQPYAEIKKPVSLLFGNNVSQETETNSSTNQISITQIKLPSSQPRRYFDSRKLEELSRSIQTLGILEPLLVRTLAGGNYELIAGERRYKAALMAGLTEVPMVVREMDDATTSQVRLVENLQREDLNPLEETEGILELLALQLNQSPEDVVSLLYRMQNSAKGKLTQNVLGNSETLTVQSVFDGLGTISWQSFINSRLPLLKLPQDILEVLRQGQVEYTKARAIAKITDEQNRTELLTEAIEYNLSLNEIKQKVKAIQQQSESESPSLKQRADDTFHRLKKSQVWDDPKKKAKVEKLLSQLDELIK